MGWKRRRGRSTAKKERTRQTYLTSFEGLNRFHRPPRSIIAEYDGPKPRVEGSPIRQLSDPRHRRWSWVAKRLTRTTLHGLRICNGCGDGLQEEVYIGWRPSDFEFSTPLLSEGNNQMHSQPLSRGKACLPCRCVHFQKLDTFVRHFVADTRTQRSQSGQQISPYPREHVEAYSVVT